MQQEFVFSGFGGQGVMFAGQLLSYAALDAGLEVTWIPSYGPEMRGGTAHCYVVISDKPIGSPLVKHPKVGIIFNKPSFAKYEPLLSPDGLLVVNASMVEERSERDDLHKLYIPATQIAEDVGTTRLANMVLLGAACHLQGTLTQQDLRHALEHHIPAHRRNLLEPNYEAVARGMAFAAEQAELV